MAFGSPNPGIIRTGLERMAFGSPNPGIIRTGLEGISTW